MIRKIDTKKVEVDLEKREKEWKEERIQRTKDLRAWQAETGQPPVKIDERRYFVAPDGSFRRVDKVPTEKRGWIIGRQ